MRLWIATAAVVATTPAIAHHGFTGRYDVSSPIYINGIVEAATFGFPHAVIEITSSCASAPPALTAEFGTGLVAVSSEQRLTVEFPPVGIFNDLEGRIAGGDQIGMVVFRNCDPPHQLRAQWVAPVAGEPVLRNRRLQDEVEGC